MNIFTLPDLGEGLPDAIIREWYVNVGDHIEQDQPMVAMETAKALVDVPAPFSGTVEKLFGQPGESIDTGAALIGFTGSATIATALKDAGTVVGNIETGGNHYESPSASPTDPSPSIADHVSALPATRMLARALGVDLTTLTPSADRITDEDVKRAAGLGEKTIVPHTGTAHKLNAARRKMAQLMDESQRSVAGACLFDHADITGWDKHTDITIRILRAMSDAIQVVPILNSFYDHQAASCYLQTAINIGIAIDTEHGLFVPVIKEIDQLTDEALRSLIDQFKAQAHARRLSAQQQQGATILMSNIGAIAGEYAVPVVTPPMIATIAFGRSKQVVQFNSADQLEQRRRLPISIGFDHRPITGGDAARFMRALIQSLQKQ